MDSPVTTSARNRLALTLLASAVVAGIADHWLLHRAEAGINVALVVMLLVSANVLTARAATSAADTPARLPVVDGWLLVALGFAVMFAWRDAEFVLVLDAFAILAALAFRAVGRSRRVREGRLRDFIGVAVSTGLSVIVTPFVLFADVQESAFVRSKALGRLGPVFIGLLLALPLVVFFGSLFAKADPAFNDLVAALTRWKFDELLERTLISGFLAVSCAGFLGAWHLRERDLLGALLPRDTISAPRPLSIGIAVGAMVLVFLLFVAIQLRYLFGGEELVRTVAGLTYAEYARSGFFEMVVASLFALPVLYAADVAVRDAGAKVVQSIRALGAVQLSLIGVVMTSAMSRMVLYVKVYGLTEDRLLASLILVWLALTMFWFAITVMRGQHSRFTFGAIVNAFVVIVALNIANPQRWIAQVNTARTVAGSKPLDGGYLSQLGADAAPYLAAHLSELPPAVRCAVGNKLLADFTKHEKAADWRGWNLSRANAADAVRPLRLVKQECATSVGMADSR